MKHTLKTVLALAIVVSMLLGVAPAEVFGQLAPRAFAESKPVDVNTPKELSSLLDDASALKTKGKVRTSGEWQYVLLPNDNYAVITGFIGESSSSLKIPDMLNGADVVGVLSDALSTNRGVRDIEVPGNVLAIGSNALPVGSTVKATSGSYAQTWARKNGHAYSSTSEYQFLPGVIDFTGIREENFNRIDANEVWLRSLEALRLKEGALFFLLDPSNMYQISYYRVISMEPGVAGFVIIHCETPDVDEVLLEYESENETLMVDLSSIKLSEGVSLDTSTSQERYIEQGINTEWGLTFDKALEVEFSDDVKLTISGGVTNAYTGTIHVGLLTTNKVTIDEEQKGNVTVTLEAKTSPFEEDNSAEMLLSLARLSKTTGTSQEISTPIGSAVVFSVGGIVNLAVTARIVVELSGEVKVSFSYTNKTTYTYTEGEEVSKSVKECEKSITGSAEGSFKAGIEASFELYIFVVKVANISLFAGIKAEAAFEFGEAINYLINDAWLSAGNDSFLLDEDINANMIDCITIKVHFVVEFSASVGVSDWLTLASAKVTIGEWYLADIHVHLFPSPIIQETVAGNTQNEHSYRYRFDVSTQKNRIHRAENCPYKTHKVEFILPDKDNEILKAYNGLVSGTTVQKPDFPAIEDYHLKLISWHKDKSMDNQSLMNDSDWPYTVNTDTSFYAKTVPMHSVQLVGANGIGINFGTISVQDTARNKSRNVDFSTGYAWIAEGERFVLPASNAAGDAISLWMPVVSEDDLTATGDSLNPNTSYGITSGMPEAITLCALTNKDIEARFFNGMNHQYTSVFVRRGDSIVLPNGPDNLLTYRFAGWLDMDGNLVTENYPTNQDTPSLLIFTALLEPTNTSGNIPLENVTIGSTVPSIGTEVSDEELFTWDDNGNGTATVTGFNPNSDKAKIYVSVPRTLGGLTVTGVSAYAFSDNETLRSMRFPSSLTQLGEYAFSNCGSLVMINMSVSTITEIPAGFASGCESLISVLYPSASAVSIGSGAFYNCRSIASVRIDGDIGDNAFDNCTRITSVTLGDRVRSIGDYAFYNCTRLTSVTMGDYVNSIGSSAFYNCSKLNSLSIPSSTTTLGDHIILGCTNLTALEINARVDDLTSSVFEIGEGSTLATLTIGGGVRRIDSSCFANDSYGYSSLTSLTINGSVRIGAYAFNNSKISTLTLNGGILEANAFYGLNSLQTVTINDGVSTIGSGAFQNCAGLTSVDIGKNVSAIGSYAFSDCSSLQTVTFHDTQLITLGDYAFANCESLGALEIPETVTEYGECIISGCSGLRTLSVGKGISTITSSTVFYIGSADSQSLKKIIVREGVTKIPEMAFTNGLYYYDYWYENYYSYDDAGDGFAVLEEITLPSTLRTIGSYAFCRSGVKKLTVNSAVDLGSNAFAGCNRLDELVYGAGSISDYAFQNCATLRKVTIGDAVSSIGDAAFAGCTNLQTIDLGSGVRQIGSYAFECCSSLTSLTIPDNVRTLGTGIIYGCTALTSLSVGSVISRNDDNYDIFKIGEGSRLNTITLREGVTSVGNNAFYNDGYSFANLTTVNFPKTLTTIGSYAFTGAGLTSVAFKSSIHIEEGAFANCGNLVSVVMKGGTIGDSAFEGCAALISFKLENVSSIERDAFRNCSSLKSLTIPDSVTSFDSSALYGCSGLEYLSIGEVYNNTGSIGSMLRAEETSHLKELVLRNGVLQISDNDFRELPFLISVTLPSTIEHIYTGAFSESSIQKLKIDGDVTIHAEAFKDCKKLTDVTISCASIEERAFMNCTSLRSFVLQAGSGQIGFSAFENCYALQTLRLGEGILAIHSRAFFNCRSLTSLAFPDSVTVYGAHLIWGCTALKNLYIGGGDPTFDWDNYYWNNYWYYNYPYEDWYWDWYYYHEYYYGHTVFSIGPDASLESLTIGEGVTLLYDDMFANYDYQNYTFYGYPALKYVSLPSSLNYIGSHAFKGSSITEICLRGDTEIGYEAFVGMQALRRFTLEQGSLGDHAFDGDAALTSLTLGEGVTSIGDYAFANCSALSSLYVPDSVTSYGYGMISGCTGLTSLSIGKGLNSSGNSHYHSFRIGANNQLERIEVREGVTRLNDNALANGDEDENILGFANLHYVSLPETLVYLGDGNISNWPAIRSLYFRYGSLLLDYNGEVPEGLTVYTDYFNARVEDYCIEHNLNYVVRDETAFPSFSLTLAVPTGTVASAREGLDGKFSIFSQANIEYTATMNLTQPVPVEGYVFYGWYCDPDFTTQWTGTTMPAQDLTLYGRIERGVEIVFAVNNAAAGVPDSGLPNGFYAYAKYTLKAGDLFPVPEEPTATSFAFYGWYSEPTFTVHHRMTEVPSANTIVYGKLARISAGGQYEPVPGGLELRSYSLQEGEAVNIAIPGKINGVPVISIAENAFDNSGIRTVRIPDTVVAIAEGAFRNDTGITVIIADSNDHYTVENGILYNKDKTTLIYSPKRNVTDSISIPDSVKRIADYAFFNNSNLPNVYFNEGLEEIGAYAFAGCSAIYDINLPDSVTTVRRNAFERCWNLHSFRAMGLTTLEYMIGNNYVETFPNNNVLMAYGPVGTGVLRDAFIVRDRNGNEYTMQYNQYPLIIHVLDDNQELSCEAGQTLNNLLSETHLEDGTLIHGWYKDSGFSQAWNLASDVMPAETLDLYAAFTTPFNSTVDYVEDENGYSYYGALLTRWNGIASSLIVPDYIRDHTADSSGYNYEKAVIGLGANFLSNIAHLESITIPSSVIYIDQSALVCSDGSYPDVIIAEADSYAAKWAAAHGVTHEKPLHTLSFVTYGESIAPIQAAEGTKVYLPIPARAGREFSGWSLYDDYQYLELDEELYTMPGEDVTLYAFWEGEDEEIDFTWSAKNQQVTVSGYTGSSPIVVVPEMINGWPVTGIGEHAFEEKTFVTEVILPDSVVRIGDFAFAGCNNLRECNLPATLNYIGEMAFARTSLYQAIIPDSVETLGKGAYSECTSLYQLQIGQGVNELSASSFSGDTRLHQITVSANNSTYADQSGILFSADGETLIYFPLNYGEVSFTVPDGTTSIGEQAFRGSQSLRSVSLPASITDIGDYAFAGCDNLAGISGDSLISIGRGAFFGCLNLTDVDVGDSLERIGGFAFGSNPSLKSITLPPTVQLDTNVAYFDSNTGLSLIGQSGSSVQNYAEAWGLAFIDPDAEAVTSITLSASELSMERGTTAVLTAEVLPSGAVSGAGITWYSSDTSIVKVRNGMLYAVGNGTASITARSGNGHAASCDVTVTSSIWTVRIDLVPNLLVGDTVQMTVTTDPAEPENNVLIWSSNHPEVASIDGNGLLTAVGIGEATITVVTENGITDSAVVTVYRAVSGISISAENAEMYAIPGINTLQLSLNVLPSNATYKSAYWRSSDRGIADVDANGLVTAYHEGNVTITAISNDPDAPSAEFDLTVKLFDINSGVVNQSLERAYSGSYEGITSITVNGIPLDEEYFNVWWTDDIIPNDVGEYSFTVSGDESRTTGEFTGMMKILPITPVITFFDKEALTEEDLQNGDFFTIDGPHSDYYVSYKRVKSNGTLTEAVQPSVNGTYQVTVFVPGTTNTLEASASRQYTVSLKEELDICPSITLPLSVSGWIPVTYRSADGTQVELWYESSDESVVEIYSDGTMYTASEGTAIITVGTMSGTMMVQCLVTVCDFENNIRLPAALTKIEAEAFRGNTAAQFVDVQEHVTTIGSKAFAEMPNLAVIDIPASVTTIAKDAFDQSNPVIICTPTSKAAQYAEAEGFLCFYQ